MTQNLYEQLETIASYAGNREPIPQFVIDGLNSSLTLRPYQEVAVADFIRYFQTPNLRKRPAHTLFHMATGSGKTLVMASLILYLYEQGHHDFIFFVNSANVLGKTKDNFLNQASSKYLFRTPLLSDGEAVPIREVSNFQQSLAPGINIAFTTIQGLHYDLNNPHENRMTYADFEGRPVVLLSDEAHHVNALTKRRLTDIEVEDERSWESTVDRILAAHVENVLLEFTATCDLNNPAIAAKYSELIVTNYPLSRYREDRYSKEIKLLQADLEPLDRALQALVISQYRLKLFERHGHAIKPVVLFKSKTIKASREFIDAFDSMVSSLRASSLTRLKGMATSDIAKEAFKFFAAEGISPGALASEIRDAFSSIHCLIIDSEKISPSIQIAVNTLEDRSNPYRAVFAVDMLNEGWDVLNLFDIVRMFETRDAKSGKPGRTTVQEAQLIGRGARYCPFHDQPDDDAFRRKFDGDLDNPMRVCEELYFHSAINSRYIDELRTALRETGALPLTEVEVEYRLKPTFRSSDLFNSGSVFLNERVARPKSAVTSLPDSIRLRQLIHRPSSGASQSGGGFDETDKSANVSLKVTTRLMSDLHPAVLSTAMRRTPSLGFNRLREVLPGLASKDKFLTDKNFLGAIRITIESDSDEPSNEDWLAASTKVLDQLQSEILSLDFEFIGSREFRATPVHEVFSDRRRTFDNPHGDGEGIAQSRSGDELRLDVPTLHWFAQVDHFGTTEEKRFLVYFNTVVQQLLGAYNEVNLIRNERQAAIFDFDTGSRFEPDFLLFLRRGAKGDFEQFQIFVEPKGSHLVEKDSWKESLLLRLRDDAVAVKVFADDIDYRIWGFPFFTHDDATRLAAFATDMDSLLP